jgi:hypothetical protein
MGCSNAAFSLHYGGKYSDLTIRCNYREWFVHRAIVCSRSGFFDGACSGQFREALNGVIDLSEDDEDAIEQMIHCKCEEMQRQGIVELNYGQSSTISTT